MILDCKRVPGSVFFFTPGFVIPFGRAFKREKRSMFSSYIALLLKLFWIIIQPLNLSLSFPLISILTLCFSPRHFFQQYVRFYSSYDDYWHDLFWRIKCKIIGNFHFVLLDCCWTNSFVIGFYIFFISVALLINLQ